MGDQTLDLYDGNQFLKTVAITDGVWTSSISGLSLGEHRLTARTGEKISDDWSVTRIPEALPLVYDASPVTLSGVHYFLKGKTPSFPQANFTRQASGGTPPYTYRSSVPSVATVSATGTVQIVGKGTTSVSVTDSAGKSIAFTLSLAGMSEVEYIGHFIWDGATQYQRPGGHLPSRNELRSIEVDCRVGWPSDRGFWWSSEYYGHDLLGGRYWGYNFTSLLDVQDLEHYSHGALCVIPK